MHVDKMQTHVISFILHIDSSEDAEPWPIFIEDLQGRTHEITLTPGDMVRAQRKIDKEYWLVFFSRPNNDAAFL